jgi:hypothetical protein
MMGRLYQKMRALMGKRGCGFIFFAGTKHKQKSTQTAEQGGELDGGYIFMPVRKTSKVNS